MRYGEAIQLPADPWPASGGTPKEIVPLMRGWRVGALPMIQDKRRVVGVVSEADALPEEELRDEPNVDHLLQPQPFDVPKAPRSLLDTCHPAPPSRSGPPPR